MSKKLVFALGCLALLTSVSTIAQADSISFGFLGSPSHVVHIDATPGVVLMNGELFGAKDTTTDSAVLPLAGAVTILTGPASTYTAAGGLLDAKFTGGAGVQIDVTSVSCTGGSMPGVCIQGTFNTTGSYFANLGSAGSFQAVFIVNYVSPFITTAFGLPNTWVPIGSDAFSTTDNNFVNGGKTDTATLGGGSVSFETAAIPEPGTLALMGSGILGVSLMIRRRRMS